ncbi:MAG: ATP-dependent 6-phosphofructokinase [Pirellulales bacterium]|nr:ATP-dependent 6-phosphofructokinase [Pirellulales bacterium]
MNNKCIGVLTSGGDCLELNAVIHGVVKSSSQLGYDCVGFLKGYEGLHDPVRFLNLTPKNTTKILNRGVTDRVEINPEFLAGVRTTVDRLGIEGLVCIGGDDSLAIAEQFHEYGIPVVGVPKTIDNDLSATASTLDFDSAIECATNSIERLHVTASDERILVVEVMGRHAVCIALHAGIAGGGDVILLPEIHWTWENVCHKILNRESHGKQFTLIVVAEGAELPGGHVGEEHEGGQSRFGNIGQRVAEEIERRLQCETRVAVLGHLQHGGAPTTFDRGLAAQYGAHAVQLILEGKFGEMVYYQPPKISSVPIVEAANRLRQADSNSSAVEVARTLGVSFGDCKSDEIPFVFEAEVQQVATANDVESDAEFALDLAAAAIEEALEKMPKELPEEAPEEAVS